jgi:hypothetical protein
MRHERIVGNDEPRVNAPGALLVAKRFGEQAFDAFFTSR